MVFGRVLCKKQNTIQAESNEEGRQGEVGGRGEKNKKTVNSITASQHLKSISKYAVHVPTKIGNEKNT